MLPTEFLEKFEKDLLLKKLQVEESLRNLETNDPVMLEVALISSEIGDASWEADVHAKSVAAQNHLLGLYTSIKKSLVKLSLGTYGKCEKCGHSIEQKRLEVLPTASVCTLCL